MSERDGFTNGFLAGVVVGGLVGGALGALVTAVGRDNPEDEQEESLLNSSLKKAKTIKSNRHRLPTEESIEVARRSLEDKIAQLNTAIDDVRQQLGAVQGNSTELEQERALDL